jgi:hypothetical protein
MRSILAVYSLIALVAMTPATLARSDGADLCLSAAAAAAEQTGVPYDVLRAVALVETGRDDQPWPWTVGVRGKGHWAETMDAAAMMVNQALAEGITNIDLGCFQLNIHWHSKAFRSVEDMLDPTRNATYAAEFLAEKYAETGDWSLAAAAYHSATPEYADAYQARFDAAWGAVAGDYPEELPAEAPPNRFPLLVGGQAASAGSLVPATTAGFRLIGAP